MSGAGAGRWAVATWLGVVIEVMKVEHGLDLPGHGSLRKMMERAWLAAPGLRQRRVVAATDVAKPTHSSAVGLWGQYGDPASLRGDLERQLQARGRWPGARDPVAPG